MQSTVAESLTETAGELQFPVDLGDWIDPFQLAQWTVEEVEKLDWQNPELKKVLGGAPDTRLKLQLILPVYGYLRGIYDSERLSNLTFIDPYFKVLDPNQTPSATVIKQSRRLNRGLLRWCIAHVLRRALAERFDLKSDSLPPGVRQYILECAKSRLDLARQIDRNE